MVCFAYYKHTPDGSFRWGTLITGGGDERVVSNAVRSENPPVYVIKAIKMHLHEVHGVTFGPDGKPIVVNRIE